MSVEINRTEVVLNNRGARGVNGTVVVTSATGQAVASRLALAAISSPVAGQVAVLTESGREGNFVFSTSDLSTSVAADTAQGIYVPPSTDTSGASGAWVRKYSGAKDARWFGATGDGTTNDATALQAWLDSGGALWLPPLKFRSASTLIVRRNIFLSGSGYGFDNRLSGYGNMPGSRIVFDAGVAGLEVEPQWVGLDWSALTATQEGGFASTIQHLALVGNGGAAATGFRARTVCHLRDVQVLDFSGVGVDIDASSGTSTSSDSGNANLSTLSSVKSISNGSHGFHVRGTDANVVKLDTCDASLNGGWGYLDEAEFANSYDNCHESGSVSGSYKSTSQVAGHTYTNCYVESFLQCDISAPSAVVGGFLAQVAANYNGTSNLHTSGALPEVREGNGYSTSQALHFNSNLWDTGGSAAKLHTWDHGVAAGSAIYGLALQGTGTDADVALVNSLNQLALYVHAGTTNLVMGGNLDRIDGSQAIGPMAPALSGISHCVGTTPTNTEYNALVDAFNTLLGYLRNGGGYHGLISP